MTADRTEDGVRVRVKDGSGETGTVLYGPYEKYGMVGKTWPGFGNASQWLVPVRFDRNGWRGVELFTPSELEPGPPRRPTHAPRRVRNVRTGEEGTALVEEIIDGVIWPGWDAAGNWRVPVDVDGKAVTWYARSIREPDDEPSPALASGEPPYGPRVRVKDRSPGRDRGRVLYRVTVPGRSWPGFDHNTKWRVPVLMDATGATLFVLATDLEPYTEPAPAEATILAEADKMANAIQVQALRDVADAAVEALELFLARLRSLAQEGDGQ